MNFYDAPAFLFPFLIRIFYSVYNIYFMFNNIILHNYLKIQSIRFNLLYLIINEHTTEMLPENDIFCSQENMFLFW